MLITCEYNSMKIARAVVILVTMATMTTMVNNGEPSALPNEGMHVWNYRGEEGRHPQ